MRVTTPIKRATIEFEGTHASMDEHIRWVSKNISMQHSVLTELYEKRKACTIISVLCGVLLALFVVTLPYSVLAIGCHAAVTVGSAIHLGILHLSFTRVQDLWSQNISYRETIIEEVRSGQA